MIIEQTIKDKRFSFKNFNVRAINNPIEIIKPFFAYGSKNSKAMYFGINGFVRFNFVEWYCAKIETKSRIKSKIKNIENFSILFYLFS